MDAWSKEELLSMLFSYPLLVFCSWDDGRAEAEKDLRRNYAEYSDEFADSALRAMYYDYESKPEWEEEDEMAGVF